MNKKISFIGGGNMTTAIVSGLISNQYYKDLITISTPSEKSQIRLKKLFDVNIASNNSKATEEADLIILAVKPQIMKEVCLDLANNIKNIERKLIITVAAGTPISFYKNIFGNQTKIIRIMPNTPSLVGEGVSGIFTESNISNEEKKIISNLFENIGKVIWLKNEYEINNIIAVTGSSPGYFFYFLEAMQQKAEKLGFTTIESKELIIQTLKGVTKLLENEKLSSFYELKQNVASKGGATEQALKIFEKHNLNEIIGQAMQTTINRAEELENELQ